MALFKNATVTFDGSAIVDVTGVDIEFGGERLSHSADTDVFETWQGVHKKTRQIVVHTDDVSDAFGVTQGAAAATLSVVCKTADGGSDLTFSGSFMCAGISGGANHGGVEHGNDITFNAVSADGSTDPVTIS